MPRKGRSWPALAAAFVAGIFVTLLFDRGIAVGPLPTAMPLSSQTAPVPAGPVAAAPAPAATGRQAVRWQPGGGRMLGKGRLAPAAPVQALRLSHEPRVFELRFTNLSLSSRRTIYGQDDVALSYSAALGACRTVTTAPAYRG